MRTPQRKMTLGVFREIQAALFDDIRAIRSHSILCPVTVVVPNNLLRLHLARALANDGHSHANVHFLTLRRLAERRASTRPALLGKSCAPKFCMELLLGEAVKQSLPTLAYFGPVATRAGFHRAMLKCFEELREACLLPGDLQHVISSIPNQRDDEVLHRKISEIFLLWECVEAAKSRLNLYDEVDLLNAAAEDAGRPSWAEGMGRFLLYGFYDFTGAQERFLEACFARMPTAVYFPFVEGAAFRYAKPAIDWLLSLGFRNEIAPTIVQEQDNALTLLQRNLCRAGEENTTFPASDNDKSVLFVSAPGEARETEEIVRETLYPPPSDTPLRRIGILLRSADPYAGLLCEAFDGCGVKGYLSRGIPLARTAAGKSLLLLANVVGSRYNRTEVMDFIASAALRPVVISETEAFQPSAAEWNCFTIKAGIVAGRQEWELRLNNLEASPDIYFNQEDSAEDEPETRPRLATSLRAFRKFISLFFDCLDAITRKHRWKDFSVALKALYTDIVIPDENTPQTLEALDELGALDVAGAPVSPELFRTFLREALENQYPETNRFEQNEPTVVQIMEARGVPFDLVILPGLVEKVFPQPARQDSILPDDDRRRLAAWLEKAGRKVNLPLKRKRQEEEELLFALAVQSARHRLVLTYPRLDATARPRIPSHFLLRALESITGQSPDFDLLDKFIQSDARGRFVRMTRLNAANRNHAIGFLEYDLATLAKAAEDKMPDALRYLTQVTPFFEQALKSESARWEQMEFSEYDGLLSSGAIRERMRISPDGKRAVSPTSLEDYACCPFNYLLKHVFRIEPMEEPERLLRMSPRDRGSLLHEILRQFLSEAAEKGELPLTMSHWSRLEQVALAQLNRFEKSGVTGYHLMWLIERSRILGDLQRFLRAEVSEGSSFRPAHFEVRFGSRAHGDEESPLSTMEGVPFDLGDSREIYFRGRMDRVDVDDEGSRSRVLDYKAGRKGDLKDDSFDGGRKLQLPLYLLAAGHLLNPIRADYAEYCFISETPKPQHVSFTSENWEEKVASLRFIVRTILDGISAGRFYPRLSDKVCKWCNSRTACGHGRFLEHKWGADHQATKDFLRMADTK